MSHPVKIQIIECEEQLKEAMLHSDIYVLDNLLANDLIFTNHLGHVMTKQDDLEAHKSKAIKISEISLSDQNIKIQGGIVIVTVKAHIAGCFNNEKSENDFRFTRVWRKDSSGAWQIVAGHSSIVL